MLYFLWFWQTLFGQEKNGHLLRWPNHWLIGGPFPKDYRLPCPSGCCHLVPVLVRHGGHSTLPWLHSVYVRLLVLSYINSLTGSVLKSCSTTTSMGTSLPWGRDCFMDVNAGHSLHRCQAVSISSSRQHWHAWSMSFFHLLIWWPNRPWPVMVWKIFEWRESCCLRSRPRSRWPHFQRSEFLNEVTSDPVHVGPTFNDRRFNDRLSFRISVKIFWLVVSDPVHVGHTFNDRRFNDRLSFRISLKIFWLVVSDPVHIGHTFNISGSRVEMCELVFVGVIGNFFTFEALLDFFGGCRSGDGTTFFKFHETYLICTLNFSNF